MDPLSQAVLGGAAAQSLSQRRQVAAAAAVGAISGMAPDIDVLIGSKTDPLLALEFHRHFTHSLFFIPFGALVCSVLLYWFARRSLGWRSLYLYSLLGYGSHGLLDACTTYGTRLFWPFSDMRVAWHNVAVIDPLFTVPMMALVVLALKRSSPPFARAALGWGVAYLLIGLIQHERAEALGATLAAARGHTPERALAMPTLGNLWLWRHVYEYAGTYYIDGIHVSWQNRVFHGGRLRKFRAEEHAWLDAAPVQASDLARFSHFADGLLAETPGNPYAVIDVRYSPLPNAIDSLWGIELNPAAAADAHATYSADRNLNMARGLNLLDMLFP